LPGMTERSSVHLKGMRSADSGRDRPEKNLHPSLADRFHQSDRLLKKVSSVQQQGCV